MYTHSHLVVVAPRGVGDEHRNVAPLRWVPVRVVVALLWALKAALVAVRVLARGQRAVLVQDAVSRVQALRA